MINSNNISISKLFTVLAVVLAISGCKKDFEDMEPATFPAIGDVFIDGFSPGLEYAAFGGSDVTGFQVVSDVTYEGDGAMRFAVPDVGDPAGSYVGGTYFVDGGRDLSGFDALTFWMKASKNANIDVIGFGNDLDENKYVATLSNVAVNSNWKQYIIPLPDPSVLIQEKGMFFYSEGPENGLGYTFWIDEVKFETLGTLAQYRPGIQENNDDVVSAETGQTIAVEGLIQTVNLPSGADVRVNAAPAYFDFTSSNTMVATINNAGEAMVLDAGTAVITAKLAGVDASGSLTIEGTGEAVLPATPAPVPTRNADSVIALYSNVYEERLVDTWDTDWEFTTTETDFVQVDGDDIIRYRMLNFVGIEFVTQTIDISSMTNFHMDIWTPDPTNLPNEFKVLLADFGPNNVFDGGDDSSHELAFTSPLLQTGEWVSIDVPLSAFAGLTGRMNLAQMVLSGNMPNVFVDNVYFYIGGGSTGGGECDPPQDPVLTTSFPIDFENCENLTGVFEAGDGVTGFPTENPDMSGNSSSKVYQFNKVANAAWYSGIFHIFPSNFDMTDDKVFTTKMWSSKANAIVRFQIEKEGSGGAIVTYQKTQTIATANTWTELTFDFSDQPFTTGTDGYDKIVIIPDDLDDGPSEGTIFYVDDVELTGGSMGAVCDPPMDPSMTTSFPVDFEACEDLSGVFEAGDGVTGFPTENPDMSGNSSSKVYQFNKVANAAWYSGIFHIFPSNFDMTDDKVFTTKMWSSKANAIVRFQIEKEGSGGAIVTYQKTQTIATANTWTELTFDFSDQPFTTGTDGYDKIVIIPDDLDDGPSEGTIFYVDDIELAGGSMGGVCDPPMDPSMTTSFPVDFEACEDFSGVFEAGDGVTGFPTENPDMSGNSSSKVYQFNKVANAAWYSGIFHIFPSNFDMTDDKVFTTKMWSSKANAIVRFQIEKEGSGGAIVTYQKTQTIATANTWTELTFDFSDQPFTTGTDGYDKIVIIPDDLDDGPSEGTIFYVDDVELTGGSMGAVCDPPMDPSMTTSFPVDFEACEDLSGVFEAGDGVTGFPTENPDMSGNSSTKVYQFNKVANAAWYSGIFHIFPSNFDMTDDKVFTTKMWSSKANAIVRFQIEKEGSGGAIVTYQKTQTIATANTWTELTFDFSDQPFTTGTDGYDKIVIIPDDLDDGPSEGTIFYVDDIELAGGSMGAVCDPPMDPSLTALPIDFESCEDFTGVFEDGDGVTGFPAANPNQTGINTSAQVYQFNKVVGSAWYSGIFHIFPSNFDMTTTKVFKMKVWSPKSNVIVRFQIEKEGMQGPIVTYLKTAIVANANTWTELVFDFSDQPFTTGTNVYDKIVIIPDDMDNGPADGSVYYIDDVSLGN